MEFVFFFPLVISEPLGFICFIRCVFPAPLDTLIKYKELNESTSPGAAEPCAHGSRPAISCSTLLVEQWTDLTVVRSWPAEERSPPSGQQCGSTLHRRRKQEGSIKVRTLHFGGLLFWSQMPVVHVETPPRHGWGPLVAGPPPPPPPQDDSGGLLPLPVQQLHQSRTLSDQQPLTAPVGRLWGLNKVLALNPGPHLHRDSSSFKKC